MPSKDWDCGKDGHIPVTKKNPMWGGRVITWCLACGKKL